MRSALVLVLLVFGFACSSGFDDVGDGPVPADAAARDAAVTQDATSPDATSQRDATSADAAASMDAEVLDAAELDAGAHDAVAVDAVTVDAAAVDAGSACAPNPCFPGVSCSEAIGGFVCGSCPAGYTGDGVQCADLDACVATPCLPGSTCTDLAPPELGQICTACMGAGCPILRAQAGADQLVARGVAATLVGGATGANGLVRCRWNNDRDAQLLTACTATVSPTNDTRYTLTVTDSEGRSASDDAVIRLVTLIADAGPSVNIERGVTATLTASWTGASCANASCISCVWARADGALVATTCTTTVSPGVSTQYVVTVTDDVAQETASDSTTVYVTDAPANLCGWDVVVMTSDEYPTAANPNYLCTPDGRSRRQTVNSRPSIVLSDLVVENARVIGFIGVETGSDDDLIGMAWGYENPAHHYLLLWKQLSQNWTARCGNALSGIAIKKVDGSTNAPEGISFNASFGYNATDYVYSCALAWSTDRNNEPLHRDGSIYLTSPRDVGAFTGGWRDFITYRFEIYHATDRSKIRIYEDEARNGSTQTLVTEQEIADSSYPRGRVAFFSNSQEQVDFGDFSFASLDGYRADAGLDRTVTAGTVATLAAQAELAVPPHRCAWFDGARPIAATCTTTVSPSATTAYSVVVTDAFDRVRSDSVTVVVQP